MAAPQQHPLTNTSCTFSSSPAAFPPTAGSYGSGKTAFCGDLQGQVSVASDRNVQSLVCSSTTVSPQPILTNSASRKTKPCSLCGTAALRSQSSLVPNSPVSPQEQPVVLLHRLEDGLPEGDVDSLRAFGTIRLLPVHCGKVEGVTDDSKHECDRKYQSVTSHTMAPGNLAYKSFKRGNIKKRTELPSVSQGYGDLKKSLTSDILRKFKASDDHHNFSEKLSEQKVKNNTNSNSGGTSHRTKKNSEARVNENSVGYRLVSGEETLGERLETLSSQQNHLQYSTVSSVSSASQSPHRVSSPQYQTLSPHTESLDCSATSRSSLSSQSNLPSPQTSTSSAVNNHSHDSTSQAHSTHDTIHQRSASPDTPMSAVCSPVLPLTTAALSSPSQNIDSPSTISPPESPPSPPSPFSPAFMGSPSTCDRENLHSSCSVDVQQSSSPYSPCTLPSLPASPTSLPSSSKSPPSPALSIDSPPISPAACEISDSQVPFSETLGGDSRAEETDSAAQLDTVFNSKADPEVIETRDSKAVPQYHLTRTSSMENDEEVSNKSHSGQKEVAQVPSASETGPAPSAQIHMPEDTSTASQNSEIEAHADTYQESSTDHECGDRENSLKEVEHLKPDFVKSSLNSESKNVEAEKNCSDSKNSLMKLVLKVKHPANQQLPVGPEKKDYNKENGIPKIVLTLRGNGPNKEYSCSNRLRNESESCSGESVNNKKHKSKRNKRQKPKDREKVKKVMKVGKHKRHVELFGEDSNDSCDIIPDNIKNHTSEGRHSRTPSTDEQILRPSFTPHATEEAPSVPDERNLAPTLSPGESPSHCAKYEESAETADSPSPTEQSLSHSLPSDTSELNTDVGDRTKSLIEDSEEITETQTECTESNTHETSNLTVEVPKTRDDEPAFMELQQEGKETSQASSGTLHSSEIDHQNKQPEGLILRSRRSRHAKNTESGRNSDTCLWVSFGVNAPMPLPATDLPSLEPLFTSKEKTKLKESETNGSKEHASSNQPKVEVKKHPPKATHKERKEREKTETQPDATKESTEHEYESKAKFLTEHSDSKTVVSHGHRKVHSSSSHEDSNGAHCKVRSHGDSTHHRSRHSHKRQRKSDDDREGAIMKETDSRQHSSLDATERDDSRSEEKSTESCKEKLATSDFTPVCGFDDVQMKTEEKSAAEESCTLPNTSSRVDGSKEGHKESPNNISHEENEVNVKPEKPTNLKPEETSDDQYYRPKKIRKAFNSKITSDHHNEITSTDQKTTKAHSDEKTVSNQPEDCKDQVSPKFSSPEVVTISSLSGMHAVESESFRVECHTSEVKTDVPWRPHEEIIRRDMLLRSPQNSETSNDQRKRKHRSPTPLGQDLVTKLGVESADEQSKQGAEGKKEEAADKLADIKKDSLPGNEDNEKKEVSKKEKEKRKKPRKEKRKDGSRPGSRCAVLQEAQFRREVEHEEGRGRRLAQEIKGFNWLEQKIKNSSLLSSRTVPSTPTSSSSGKELESPSKSVSSTPTTSSSHFTFGNKEEEHARKNSFSGSSSSIGFKRHLQTAVPPLIPSSKVTALPKRRPSLGTPITPPCSAPPTLCSATSVPSMIVQGALYTCEPTPYRSGHGRVPPPLEKSSTSLEHAEADKATLYSSTSSTKATLYGVKDNSLEALYDTVSVNAVNYYDNVTSGNIDTQYNITTSPPICFYGSAKYQEPGLHPDKTPATGPHAKSSVISTSQDSGGMTDHQVDKLHSPKPDTCSSRNSDWSAWQGSSPNSQHSGYSADPHSPQRFSHKQALLRRAFQEMMKSDSNNSSTEQTKEKESVIQSTPTKTEINMADESMSKEMETPGSTTGQSSSESTSSVDIKSLKSQCPDNTPPLLLNKCFSEPTERHIFSYSPRSIAASLNSEKDVIDPVCTENKISTSANKQGAENVGCKVDSNKKIVVAESSPNITENDSDKETSLEKINDDKNVKVPKDLQSDVIDCIRSESGDIDMKVLKEEICYKGDGKSEEDAEVQPRLLLSVLYKELMKTRQEVEKLRKVQELMLTEKEEKKEDAGEQNSETKVESETVDENSHNNERNLEKRKDHESSDVKLKIDDEEECYYHESKKSKISIRSDLLPREDSVGLDTTSSNTSASQKIISLSHQSSSPTLTNPAQVQSNLEISMTSLKGSAVPDTSHASRVSPAIPAVSPGLSSSISVSPNLTTSQPRGHPRASPGVSSPGIPRTSPGIPRPSPPITRASPGIPKSNSGSIIVSPGASVSPAVPSSSPGITSSPGVPRSSPGVLRMSPGLPRIHSGISRISPGAPLVSPGPLVVSPAAPVISPGIPMVSPSSSRNGLGLIRNDSEVTVINPGTTQMSPSSSQGNMFNTPTNPSSAEDLHISYSNPAVTTAQPKITTVQSVISPVVPVPRFPQIPLTSTAVPIISPTGGKTNSPVPRISPSTSKIDPVATVPLKKTSLTNMSPTKLRSVFGISNSEVELMPVSVGPKQSLHEPQPRTFLNLIEDQHHQTTEMPLLLNAVQGVHQESGSKNVESSSHGAVPFHSLAGHEDLKRISKAHQYPGEIKRHALSTSDLPDHASSACKQPPPLKPATTLVRRHSDNMDIHSAMHHHPLYSGTRKNLAGSLHSSAAPTELKNPNTAHSFNQPQYSPTQYPLTNPRGRRNTDANSTERNRGYQQTVPMGMQHQFAHLPPGSSVMRSLGPDKATIFPIPPTMPASIRPFRPSVLPPATRTHLEQLQNENFYRTNFSFFEKIREKFAQPCDNGVSAMDRLQASTANVEKPMQPQTFAPRVLVRESIPEAHTPTTSYTMHFSNQNQPPHNVMPSHQNHFSTNMHSGPSLQHLTQARLHSQATSSMQRANSSSVRSGEKLCFHCPQQARFICSGCKKAWYCSEQCQREHWSVHSSACVL